MQRLLYTLLLLVLLPTSMAAQARTNIAPMLSTRWNQNGSYNSYCPAGCPTGCVATAVSQVMYYWYEKEHFEANQALAIPAYTTVSTGRSMQEQTPTDFAWSQMANNSATALLMFRVGCSVHMDYRSGGSDAKLAEVPIAMKTYFGYDKGMWVAYRQDYTSAEWDDLIYCEIAAGRPVVFGGCELSSGHCIVADGYQDGKYHFNFGWGGSSDGYYSLHAISSYNMYVNAVIGFQPPRANTAAVTDPYVRLTTSDLTFSGFSVYHRQARSEDFRGVSVYTALYNRMQNPVSMVGRAHYHHFDVGMGLYDTDGRLLRVISERAYGEFIIGDGLGDELCFDNMALGAELPYGDYRIKAISREHGTKTWHEDAGSDRHYITARISEKKLELIPSAYLSVSDFTTSGFFLKTTSFTLTNLGTEETTSPLYLRSNTAATAGVQTAVAPNSTSKHSLSKKSGTQIASDRWGRNLLYTTDTTQPYIALADSMDNVFGTCRADSMLIGNELRLRVYVTNKHLSGSSYSGTVKATVGTSSQSASVSSLKAGETACVAFTFGGLAIGQQHTLTVAADNVQMDKLYFTPTYGCVVADAEGHRYGRSDDDETGLAPNAVYVDARASQKVAYLHPSANPNCLYLLAAGTATPTALVGCNVVTGEVAPTITLADNAQGFDTPIAFTADQISYTRVFEQGNRSQTDCHWDTLVLPFDVSAVTCNGQTLKWFNQTNKTARFWLYTPTRDEEGAVYYGNTDCIQAYMPYIISVPAADYAGAKWDLTGKEMVFSGTHATIMPSHKSTKQLERYDMIGRHYGLPRNYVFRLNDEGTCFEPEQDTQQANAFRAYFVRYENATHGAKIQMLIDDDSTTGIEEIGTGVDSAGFGHSAIYRADGTRVTDNTHIDALPKGVYIINGKKIIK